MTDPAPLARRAHVYEAATGDVCDVSRCGRDGLVRIGWAMDGDEPTRTLPYCRRHAEPWVKLPPNYRAPSAYGGSQEDPH